jgi:outer membrane protein assembly factor BamD (BamD/ComL family)
MNRIRPIFRFVTATCFIMSSVVLPAVAQQPSDRQSLNSLEKAYQQVLFEYFQGNFEQALTLFSILESRYPNQLANIPNPGVSPELLKGGMSLAFGLDQQAGNIFKRLLSENTDAKTRIQAWMMLGKSFYQKQQFEDASKALANISVEEAQEHLEVASQDELIYLRSQLYYGQGTQASAPVSWLSELSGDSVYYDYVRYNQGLAELQQGEYQKSAETLSTFSEGADSNWLSGWFSPLQASGQAEANALRDRAFVTLGYAHLQNSQANKAIAAFDQVRLDSLDTQAALLGYGWAASINEDYQLALSVWSRLQQNLQSSEYVLEAYLASAFAYERAFAPSQALTNLQLGLERYQSEVSSLQGLREQVNNGFFIDLAKTNQSDRKVESQLTHLLLKKSIRIELEHLRESLALQTQLIDWQTRLATFDLMLDEREIETENRTAQLKQNQTLGQLALLKQSRDSLSQTIALAQQDVSVLMPEQEIAWQVRLDRASENYRSVEQNKQRLQQKPLSSRYQQRLKRLQGLMLWNASEASNDRIWQAKKQLAEINQLILKTTAQQAILEARIAKKPEFPEQRSRIQAIRQRLAEQMSLSEGIVDSQLVVLHSAFNVEFEKQLAQLKDYQLQAQLALVRLNDGAFRKIQAEQRQGGQSNVQ